MSITPLLEILHSESKILSDKNAARIHVNIITQAGHHIVFDYVAITEIKNIKQEVLKCVVCYYICVFPIVIPCGHLICSCCYVRHFKLNHYKRVNSYYIKCPHCMEFINFLTLWQILKKLRFTQTPNHLCFIEMLLLNALMMDAFK